MKPRWTSACFLPPCFVSNIFPHWRQVNLWSSVWLIMASTTAFRSRKAKIIPRPDFCFAGFPMYVVVSPQSVPPHWMNWRFLTWFIWVDNEQLGWISEHKCQKNLQHQKSFIACLLLLHVLTYLQSFTISPILGEFSFQNLRRAIHFYCMVQGQLTCLGCSLV